MSDGTYSNCTITVTDSAGNASNTLVITSFIADSTAATLEEVTVVTTPTNDNTPDYTFSSSEAGTITYGGSCSSSTTSATTDNNTITLVSLSEGTYSNCTITVTDNGSNNVTLNISSFIIDTTAPTIAEVSAVQTPSGDNTSSYTFSSDEAGTITYGGSCSSTTTAATADNNTITFNALAVGTYNDCTLTVKDNTNNVSDNLSITSFTIVVDTSTPTVLYVTSDNTSGEYTTGTLNISSFVIDTTAPTVSSISTTADNQSSVSITDNITVTFSEAMDTTYVTTNTDNTSCSGTLRVSSDNFSNCVQMASSPSSSNSDKTFTLDPSDNLTGGTTYLTRVTTGVKDSAGNTLSSQYVTSSGFTTADYALNFDGTNDYVSIPNNPFSNNNTFTIQVWLKPEAVGDNAYHGFVGIQTSGRKPSLWVSAGGDLHYDSYKGSQRFYGTISDGSNKFFTASEWVHVGWTNDGSNYKFYKNGNLVATVTAPDTFNALDNIGYQIGKVDNYFKGQIDEVAIWDVALSAADVTALYNSGIGLKASVDTGNYDKSGDLVGYWQFNEGTGSALTDNTSNSNNGTLNNMDSSPWVTSGLNLTN